MVENDSNCFTIEERKSRRISEVKVSDADNIALTSNLINEAQQLLTDIEIAASKVGLYLNAKKTEVLIYNQPLADIMSQSIEKNQSGQRLQIFRILRR